MTFFKSLPGRALILTVIILIGSVAWNLFSHWSAPEDTGPKFPEELSDVILPMPKTMVPFQLLDHNRKPFTLDNLKGQWTFLFFGYTHCPDVCPVAMGMLSEVFNKLHEAKSPAMDGTKGVFITVDPQRDTPEHLKQYVLYFNPEFLGVTGSKQQIKEFTKQIGALYFMEADFKDPEKPAQTPPEEKTTDTSYQVSHTTAFFLLDPLGRLVGIFPEYNNTDMIIEEYVRIRKFVKIRNIYSGTDAGKTK